MALIEIDGLPIKNGGSFHGKLLNNKMVDIIWSWESSRHWFIMAYYGLLWFIMAYYGLLWLIMVYHGLLWFIMVYYISLVVLFFKPVFLSVSFRQTPLKLPAG